MVFFKTPGGVQCAARADSHFNRKNKSGRTPIFRSEGNTGLTLPQFRINESKLFPFPFSTWSHRRNYFELNYCPTYLLNKSIFLLGNKSNLFFEIWVENTKILFLQSAQFEVIYSISCWKSNLFTVEEKLAFRFTWNLILWKKRSKIDVHWKFHIFFQKRNENTYRFMLRDWPYMYDRGDVCSLYLSINLMLY